MTFYYRAEVLKLKLWIGLICLLIAASPAPAQAQDASIYTVKAGDNLYRIALKHDLSVAQLKELNGLTSNTIYPGQVLRVGGEVAAAPADTEPLPPSTSPADNAPDPPAEPANTSPAYGYYIAQAGDTFYSLAARFNLSTDTLFAINGSRTKPLAPGDTLRLPAGPTLTLRNAAPLTPDARGDISVYPDSYIGRLTAGGEPYDPGNFTVSHPSLPFGTIVLLTNPANGRRTFARVNDRGPASAAFMIDVSAAVAGALGLSGDERQAIELYVVE